LYEFAPDQIAWVVTLNVVATAVVTPMTGWLVAQGFFGMSVVVGPAIGPALGGYLAEAYNWRWIFLLMVPLLYCHPVRNGLAIEKRIRW